MVPIAANPLKKRNFKPRHIRRFEFDPNVEVYGWLRISQKTRLTANYQIPDIRFVEVVQKRQMVCIQHRRSPSR